MPSQSEIIRQAIDQFENSVYPQGISPRTSWLGFYQVLLWYDDVNHAGYVKLPHIVDINCLRPPSKLAATKWTKPRVWQKRAAAVSEYLGKHLEVGQNDVRKCVDRLMPAIYEGDAQRQNALGIAFAGLLKHALEKYGPKGLKYQTEVLATDAFPGFPLQGRSAGAKIDILASGEAVPVAVISTKWSLRNDRLNDLMDECPSYKHAFNRLFTQKGRKDLKYIVVTNEFQPARLLKLINHHCIDAVVHVHKPAVVDVCGLNGRLSEMKDLPELLSQLLAD